MKGYLVIIILFICVTAFTQKKQALLHIQYGKYNIGITQKKIKYNDSVEALITIWQPAIFSKSSILLTVKDCFQLDKVNNPEIADTAVNDIICGDNYTINADTLKALLSTKTNTSKNHLPVNKKFPVVCWSSRHGTEYYQFAMSEYLASHGYIVFTISRISPVLPFPWETENISKEKFLNEHLDMLNQQLDFIKKYPQADTSKIAMFTWSYGSPFAILTQQAHKEIDAVFGFSSVDFRKEYFLEGIFNKKLAPGKLRVPYYLFYEELSRLNIRYDTGVLHPVHQDISRIFLFPKLWHGNFNYAEGYLPGLLNLPVTHPWAKPGANAARGYEKICELAVILLDRQFKKRLDTERKISELKAELPIGFFKEAR